MKQTKNNAILLLILMVSSCGAEKGSVVVVTIGDIFAIAILALLILSGILAAIWENLKKAFKKKEDEG